VLQIKAGVVEFARASERDGRRARLHRRNQRACSREGHSRQDRCEVNRTSPRCSTGASRPFIHKIAGGILPSRSKLRASPRHRRASGILPIDIGVCQFSMRFQRAWRRTADARLEDLIENIDIGGPDHDPRAAKKLPGCRRSGWSPADYGAVIEEMRKDGLSNRDRWRPGEEGLSPPRGITMPPSARAWKRWIPPAPAARSEPARAQAHGPALRREIRTKAAALYGKRGQGLAGAEQLHGKELSYNNLVDLDAAWQLAAEFSQPPRPS